MKKKFKDRPQSKKSTVFEYLDKPDEDKPSQLSLSSEKMAQLISLADIDLAQNSPIPDFITPTPSNMIFMDELIESNWAGLTEVGETSRLNDQAKDALVSILKPETSVQLTLGSIKELVVTELYSKTGFNDHALVAYTFREEEDLHVITPYQSPSDVSDTLLVQLMNGPRLEGLSFELQLEEDKLLVYLAVLDLIYTRQLEAKLQADNYAVLNFNATDVWQRFTELRIGDDLLWCSVLLPILFPNLQLPITEEVVQDTLTFLADEELLTPMEKEVFQPSEFTLALAEGLLPMISFASCAVHNEEDEGFHTGFIIGLNVNLVIQALPDRDKNAFVLNGMDGVRLSRLLFEIGLPEENREDETH